MVSTVLYSCPPGHLARVQLINSAGSCSLMVLCMQRKPRDALSVWIHFSMFSVYLLFKAKVFFADTAWNRIKSGEILFLVMSHAIYF